MYVIDRIYAFGILCMLAMIFDIVNVLTARNIDIWNGDWIHLVDIPPFLQIESFMTSCFLPGTSIPFRK